MNEIELVGLVLRQTWTSAPVAVRARPTTVASTTSDRSSASTPRDATLVTNSPTRITSAQVIQTGIIASQFYVLTTSNWKISTSAAAGLTNANATRSVRTDAAVTSASARKDSPSAPTVTAKTSMNAPVSPDR